MNRVLNRGILVVSLLLPAMRAAASPDVEYMSDIEVSEYAIRMSNVLESIQDRRVCGSDDVTCVRAEFSRHGVSYDDKEAVKKRLYIMKSNMY